MTAVESKELIKLVREASNELFTGIRKDPKGAVKSTHTEELVIALCGPIGSPIGSVSNKFIEIISEEYNYEFKVIKISDLICEYGEILLKKPLKKTLNIKELPTA